MTIYHITRREDWERAQAAGSYRGDTLDSEGFIHCSSAPQALWVANRIFRGQPGLVVLAIDPAALDSRLVYEESEPGQHFPHIYGPLNLGAVVAVHPFPPQADGSFVLPEGVV